MKIQLLLSAMALAPLTIHADCPCPYCPEMGSYYGGRQNISVRPEMNPYFQTRGDRFVTDQDQNILTAIRDALNAPQLSTESVLVDITVDHGNVLMIGVVDTDNSKKLIVEAVKGVEGVRNVNSQLETRGLPQRPEQSSSRSLDQEQSNSYRTGLYQYLTAVDPMQRSATSTTQNAPSASDASLKQKIVDKLTNVWIGKSFKNITVEVQNGKVTLTGTVDSQADLKEIESRINKIAEIKNVRNDIKVGNAGAMRMNLER